MITRRGCSDVPHDAHAVMAHKAVKRMTHESIHRQAIAYCAGCRYGCGTVIRTKGFNGCVCNYNQHETWMIFTEMTDWGFPQDVKVCKTIDKDSVGQYTGLHDKNGKEIYEGDICKALLFGYEQFVEVYWDDDMLRFRVKNERGTSDLSSYHDDVEIAVCGNIYKNPELLEGEHERTD